MKEIHGTWYELERSPILTEFALKCLSIRVQQFYNQQAHIVVESINSFSQKTNHQLLQVQAEPDFLHTGKLTRVKQNDGDDNLDNLSFQILSTDYKSYLVLWGCQNFVSSAHSESLWIFGRNHVFSNHLQSSLMDQIRTFGLAHLKLQSVDQSNCT
ncbi:unnamed protein product [Allacma fusca]|uniref:Apolipoprotein D n=1 Tax=Allacma fusca TaxID=39272 RepID=A0A8J2LT25_9HEXA|nr:unnamed protein product [Allacma fusca]